MLEGPRVERSSPAGSYQLPVCCLCAGVRETKSLERSVKFHERGDKSEGFQSGPASGSQRDELSTTS